MPTDEPTRSVPEQPPGSLGAKIVRSVLFGALRYLLVVPIPFIVTPIVLHKIGVAGYGTWAVFLAMNGLTSLADLGLTGTVSKFVAEYYAKHDFVGLNRLLDSGLALFLGLDFVICSTMWGLSPFLAHKLFAGTTLSLDELTFLLRCFLIVVTSNILGQLLASITTGLQRLDLTNVISAGNVLLSASVSTALVLRGLGVRGLVYGYAVSAVSTVIVYLLIIKKLLPTMAFNPLGFDGLEARKMFGYSLRLYLTQAAVAVHNQIEKVFLAVLVGVAPVGFYEMASDVALKVRNSIGFILSPVLPAASELDALGDVPRMKELYYRAHKYFALCGVPVLCYVVSVSHRLVELWLGPKLTLIALPMSVLLFSNFINLATGPGFLILAGRGDLRPGMQSAFVGVMLNVILSLGLILKFGFPGAVLGTSIAMILASGYFIAEFHRRTRYPGLKVLSESYFKPFCCAVLILILLFVLHAPAKSSWLGLAARGVIFASLYLTAIVASRFFDDYDWHKMAMLLPAVRHLRRALPSA